MLTDAGAGLNSDLLAAMEWAATPAGTSGCSIGAHVVNLSLATDSRPARLNTNADLDLVSLMVNRLAVRYGTLFVGAAANSQFLGSVHESPSAAAQALTVASSAKDYDVNHDDTLSGDVCAGYQQGANDCSAGRGSQPASLDEVPPNLHCDISGWQAFVGSDLSLLEHHLFGLMTLFPNRLTSHLTGMALSIQRKNVVSSSTISRGSSSRNGRRLHPKTAPVGWVDSRSMSAATCL